MTESELQAADLLGIDKWRELHRDELGVLHQISFYRVVLDEAVSHATLPVLVSTLTLKAYN